MSESPSIELWEDMVALWERMKAAKPTERSELARRYAVAITEYEKVMAYYSTFIIQGLGGEETN